MIRHLEISIVRIFAWPRMKLHIYLTISVIHSTLYCHKNSSTVNKWTRHKWPLWDASL